jgi:hypothetical protein
MGGGGPPALQMKPPMNLTQVFLILQEQEEQFMRKEEETEREAAENERLQPEKLRVKHEKQEAKKQRGLERKQRLKAEGMLMMVKQRHEFARYQQYLQALQDQGLKINQ